MAREGYDYFETGKVRTYKHSHIMGVAALRRKRA
jgi:hypothetical protein